MSDLNNTLGNNIRNLREDLDMTQKELSSMIGLTPKMISFYENNQRTPPLDILIKLASIFNVTLDELVNFKPLTPVTSLHPKITWDNVLKCFPNAIRVSPEVNDLINYYHILSITDRRWIMGQIIDLIKKEENTPQNEAVGK